MIVEWTTRVFAGIPIVQVLELLTTAWENMNAPLFSFCRRRLDCKWGEVISPRKLEGVKFQLLTLAPGMTISLSSQLILTHSGVSLILFSLCPYKRYFSWEVKWECLFSNDFSKRHHPEKWSPLQPHLDSCEDAGWPQWQAGLCWQMLWEERGGIGKMLPACGKAGPWSTLGMRRAPRRRQRSHQRGTALKVARASACEWRSAVLQEVCCHRPSAGCRLQGWQGSLQAAAGIRWWSRQGPRPGKDSSSGSAVAASAVTCSAVEHWLWGLPQPKESSSSRPHK